MVPKHEIATEKEVADILEKYHATIDLLPKIVKDDPAIKDLKAEVGTVIKITRENPSTGATAYYRVVIE